MNERSQGRKERFCTDQGDIRLSRDFSVIVLALVVVSLGFGLLSPLLPTFRDILGMSESELGAAYSLFAFAFVFALPPAGLLADKVGRKRMIMSGVLLFGITTFALILITEPYQFALLRILEGVGCLLYTSPSPRDRS